MSSVGSEPWVRSMLFVELSLFVESHLIDALIVLTWILSARTLQHVNSQTLMYSSYTNAPAVEQNRVITKVYGNHF